MEKLFEKPKVMIFEGRNLDFDESKNKGLAIPFVTGVHGFFIEKSEGRFKTFYLDEMYKVIDPKMWWSTPCGELIPLLKYEEGEKIDYKEFLWICNKLEDNSLSLIEDGRISNIRRDDLYTYNSLIDSNLIVEKFPDNESRIEIFINDEKRKEDGMNYCTLKLEVRFKLSSMKDYIVMKETCQRWKRLKDDSEISNISDIITRKLYKGRELFSNRNVSLSLSKGNIYISSSLSRKSIEHAMDGIMELVKL